MNGSFVRNVIGMIDIQTVKATYFPMQYGKCVFGNDDLKFRLVALSSDPK